jgi:hypothetical protein
MRRLRSVLPAIVSLGLLLGLGAPALALSTRRVPSTAARIGVTLTFPLGSRGPEHRNLTKAATVVEVVRATNALRTAQTRGVCPMIMRLGPVLTVVFRNARGSQLAEAEVQVVQGTHGNSGSSRCFPIRFTRGRQDAALVGNGWVRLIGHLIGTAIS